MKDFSVDKIAQLAYLKLSPQERQTFESQFDAILNYVNQLNEVPMTAEEAKEMGAFHITNAFYKTLALDPSISLREEMDADVEKLNLSNEQALKNAPKTSGIPGELLFEVPSIIER